MVDKHCGVEGFSERFYCNIIGIGTPKNVKSFLVSMFFPESKKIVDDDGMDNATSFFFVVYAPKSLESSTDTDCSTFEAKQIQTVL